MVSSTLREDWVYSLDKSFTSFLKEKSNILRSDAYWSFGGKKKKKHTDLVWINLFKLDTHYQHPLQSWLQAYYLLYIIYEPGLNTFLEEVCKLSLFT